MRIRKLDTNEICEVSEIEGVSMIDARVAVEAAQAPETAALDRTRTTAMKPRPIPKTPPREKRGRKRR
jgi:hypothetical protein